MGWGRGTARFLKYLRGEKNKKKKLGTTSVYSYGFIEYNFFFSDSESYMHIYIFIRAVLKFQFYLFHFYVPLLSFDTIKKVIYVKFDDD